MAKFLQAFFLVYFVVWAESSAQLPQGYSNIPLVSNVDSLERDAAGLNKGSIAYYRALLALEKSREVYRSCFIGRYASTIEEIAKSRKHLWGQGFAAYLVSLRYSIFNKGSAENGMEPAKKSLKIFEQTGDSAAAFLAKHLLFNLSNAPIKKYHFLISLDSVYRGFVDRIKAETDSLILPYFEDCQKFALNSRDTLLKIKFQIFYLSNMATIWRDKQSPDNTLAQCQKLSDLISGKKEWSFFKADEFNLKGNLYYLKGAFDSTLYYQMQACRYIVNEESSLNVILNCNIGAGYFTKGLPEKGAPFLLQCIDYNRRLDDPFPGSAAFAHKVLAKGYYAALEQNYHLAYNHLDSFVAITEPINNQSRIEEFRNFKMQSELNEKIQRAQILEIKNRQSTLGLIAVSLLICLLGIILLNVLRSRKKLDKAYREIQDLQGSRERFYSIVAHDLKSPLSSYQGIAATVSYLIKKKEYEKIEKISRQIDESGVRLQLMLQNLFEWSLSEQQNLVYTPRSFRLNEVLDTLIPVYENLSAVKGIRFEKELSGDSTLFTDPNYLSTIIRNLLDNAIKNAGPGNGVSFRCAVTAEQMQITVTNPGAMDTDRLSDIRQFLLSEDPAAPGTKGIGLGLILMRDFARKMNGTISLGIEEGIICFQLTIPLAGK